MDINQKLHTWQVNSFQLRIIWILNNKSCETEGKFSNNRLVAEGTLISVHVAIDFGLFTWLRVGEGQLQDQEVLLDVADLLFKCIST